jgi:cytochrome c
MATVAAVAVLLHVPLQAAEQPASQAERPDNTAEEPQHFGFGRAATTEEIAAWDIDVRPDGKGLPPGEGSVTEGRQLYQTLCAVCHGASGVEGPNDRLVVHSPDEPFPDASDADSWQHRTIGNYWPYATTLYDYIYRAMPQNIPGSLSPQQTYSLTAYLLFLNGLIDKDQRLDANNLPQIEMPARDRFVVDDRLEYDVVR